MCIRDSSDCVYLGDLPNADMKTGTVFLFKLAAPTQPVVVKSGIGIIDYIKGEIKLNPINFISTKLTRGVIGAEVPLIQISASPHSNDVIGLQDLYLQLDTSNSCLLYTSPSPRDVEESRMPSSA